MYGPSVVRIVLRIYVEVIRGTPLMLQLYVIFFLLPRIGLTLDPVVAGIAGLAINYSAYEAEIYRAGLQAIPIGQMEAALALGMTRATAIRRVIVPQAVRIVIPPVTNDFIALFKDTSVCSVITLEELTKEYNILALSTGRIVEFGITAAVLYMAMSLPLSWFSGWFEKKLSGESTKGVAHMIEVENLVKSRGNLPILRGVSLSVSRGEVAVVVGPSGCGKSTFLRCLNGLERFEGGRVVIDGLALTSDATAGERKIVVGQVCRRVGMVFQAFNLFPHWSALNNVAEPPRLILGISKDEAQERARRLLDRVGLVDRLGSMPRELSGGQQQRVAIARALAMNPKAILFDEPTSALDPRMTAEVLGVMTDLAKDGQTMIVVTHAMKFARNVANTVHVFDGGKVVESGAPEQIFDAPRTEAARLLLAEVQAA